MVFIMWCTSRPFYADISPASTTTTTAVTSNNFYVVFMYMFVCLSVCIYSELLGPNGYCLLLSTGALNLTEYRLYMLFLLTSIVWMINPPTAGFWVGDLSLSLSVFTLMSVKCTLLCSCLYISMSMCKNTFNGFFFFKWALSTPLSLCSG